MVSKKKKDLQKVAKREGYFSTLAKKEGKGAKVRAVAEAKKGFKESAKDSREEVVVDNSFAVKRKKIATAAKQKIKRLK